MLLSSRNVYEDLLWIKQGQDLKYHMYYTPAFEKARNLGYIVTDHSGKITITELGLQYMQQESQRGEHEN